MMEITDLPDDIVGIRAYGTLTEDDYQRVLIPATEKKLSQYKRVKMLFHLADMDGVEPAAIWEDTKYGARHWSEFSHIALVTDNEWIKAMTRIFTPFFPGEVRIFSSDNYDSARDWIIQAA